MNISNRLSKKPRGAALISGRRDLLPAVQRDAALAGGRHALDVQSCDAESFLQVRRRGVPLRFPRPVGPVKCPTLVLAGELDPVTPMADSDDIAAALPSALVRYERFPGA